MNKDIEKLEGLDPCSTGLRWFKLQPDFATAWNTCERGDWMLWYAAEIGVNIHKLTLAKAHCASLVIHLMEDERSINAVKVAKRFGNYKATREELDAAYASAAACAYYTNTVVVSAAAYAASDSAANAANASLTADSAANATAYAAAAANAAYDIYVDSARYECLKQCADICRKYLTKSVLKNG